MKAPGLGYILLSEAGDGGPIAKFIPDAQRQEIARRAGARQGDAIFFACAQEKPAIALIGSARTKIAQTLGLINESQFHFCWITDMPMFERNAQTGKLQFLHNPFSMPQPKLEELDRHDPLEILGWQYDIVCNGVELSSGAIRNHHLPTLYKVFEIMGWSREQVDQQFGAMVRALSCGAPPHGGIAPGIDRMAMLLAGVDNLRDVVMFPMNQQAQDLLMGAPSHLHADHLNELHIKLAPSPKPEAALDNAKDKK